jgi:hypothetical protein
LGPKKYHDNPAMSRSPLTVTRISVAFIHSLHGASTEG